MVSEAEPRGFDNVDTAIASMHAVAEVEIASALEYAHARAAALIAEAEAEAESIRAAARVGGIPLELAENGHRPLDPVAVATPVARAAGWPMPVEALLPMVALVLVLIVALAWMG